MQNDLWLDVLAGGIFSMLWAAGTLWMRRMWLETKHPMAMACLIVFLSFGAFIVISRASYWAAERHHAIVVGSQ